MLKFWSFIYRLTGWYSPWAEVAEYRMLQEKFPSFFNKFHVSLEIGMWQAHHRFYRKFKVTLDKDISEATFIKRLLAYLTKPTKKGPGKKNVKRTKRKKV